MRKYAQTYLYGFTIDVNVELVAKNL